MSRDTLLVERDSVPLHLVTLESEERSRALAAEVARQPDVWQAYGLLLGELHMEALKEILRMNPQLGKDLDFDVQPIIDLIGQDRFFELRGVRKVIDQLGAQKVIDLVGAKPVIEALGPERFIAEMGLDWLLSASNAGTTAGAEAALAVTSSTERRALLDPARISRFVLTLPARNEESTR